MNEKIMIVDDEKEIADLVELVLKNENYEVFKFYEGASALAFIEKNEVDCAVLDIMLPDMDGFSICQKIREKHQFPIIMLTAKVEDMDKITGLTVGADDYITKPFNPQELLARVKAQIRKMQRYLNLRGRLSDNECEYKGLYINRDTHQCILNKKEIQLTPIEFNILYYLLKNQGKVISSEELFEAVWKEKFFDSNNTVMAHIARIREKLNEPVRNPKIIKTVWGVGYYVE